MIVLLTVEGITLGKFLLIAGLLIMSAAIYHHKQKQNERQMKRLGGLLGLNLSKVNDGTYRHDAIVLKGILNGYSVDIVNVPNRQKKIHEIMLRIKLKKENSSKVQLKRSKGIQKFIDKASGNDMVVGFADFDDHFKVYGDDTGFIQQLFDAGLCSDFTANCETFDAADLFITEDHVDLREQGAIKTENQADRIVEIVHFLTQLAERVDMLNGRRRPNS